MYDDLHIICIVSRACMWMCNMISGMCQSGLASDVICQYLQTAIADFSFTTLLTYSVMEV